MNPVTATATRFTTGVLSMNRFVAIGILALVNLVHPFIHAFESGGLDVWLVWLDGLAMQADPLVPHNHSHDHTGHPVHEDGVR